MIQRVQSLYLLGSILVCFILYFLPLGQIGDNALYRFSVCGIFENESDKMVQINYLLSALLSITLLIQLISIFSFRNRKRQAMLTQVSLILLLLFVVITLLYQDIFPINLMEGPDENQINYNWNIILLGISWTLTYLALRAIKKDDAIIRSADRMR